MFTTNPTPTPAPAAGPDPGPGAVTSRRALPSAFGGPQAAPPGALGALGRPRPPSPLTPGGGQERAQLSLHPPTPTPAALYLRGTSAEERRPPLFSGREVQANPALEAEARRWEARWRP